MLGVCKNAVPAVVPPGWYYISSNKVVRCPEGEYRTGYVAANATGANQCVRCPRGTTTFASASPEFKYCDGERKASLHNLTNVEPATA